MEIYIENLIYHDEIYEYCGTWLEHIKCIFAEKKPDIVKKTMAIVVWTNDMCLVTRIAKIILYHWFKMWKSMLRLNNDTEIVD